MRDVNRIDVFCSKLANIWKTDFPDWRFGQLMFNFMSWYGDPFYLEEDQLIQKIEEFRQYVRG